MLLVATAWIAYGQNAPPENKLEKIKDDLYVITGDGGNSTIYLTDEGVILVDDKFERDAADVLAKVKELTDKPIKFVFNTHAHTDHTGANPKLPSSAVIVAHSNTQSAMVQKKVPGAPQMGFTDEMEINLGGKQVIAKYFGRGHTDGDIAVYFPASKVIATGDMFNMPPSGVHIDYASGGKILDWVHTLDGMLKWDFDTVIPGHQTIAKRADLIKNKESVAAAIVRVRGMVREGTTKDAVAKVLVSEFGWNPTGQGIRNDIDGLMAELKP